MSSLGNYLKSTHEIGRLRIGKKLFRKMEYDWGCGREDWQKPNANGFTSAVGTTIRVCGGMWGMLRGTQGMLCGLGGGARYELPFSYANIWRQTDMRVVNFLVEFSWFLPEVWCGEGESTTTDVAFLQNNVVSLHYFSIGDLVRGSLPLAYLRGLTIACLICWRYRVLYVGAQLTRERRWII